MNRQPTTRSEARRYERCGFRPHEIAAILRISEQEVRDLLRGSGSRAECWACQQSGKDGNA